MARFLLLAISISLVPARADVPEQSRLWGSAGPDLPPPPPGWSEAREPRPDVSKLGTLAEDLGRGCILFAPDQGEHDDIDRSAVATIEVSPRAGGDSLRLSILAGGKPVAVLTSPLRSIEPIASSAAAGAPRLDLLAPASARSSRLLFDPSALAPGAYEARAEVFDRDGKVGAASSAAFRRLPGPP
jgi:hypothetical protein